MIVALTFMTVADVLQVILRYGFGGGFVWSLEATTYAFAWLVLIGMSYGVRTRGAHRGRSPDEPPVAERARALLLRSRSRRVSCTAAS